MPESGLARFNHVLTKNPAKLVLGDFALYEFAGCPHITSDYLGCLDSLLWPEIPPMNPFVFAMRRAVKTLLIVLALISCVVLGMSKIRVDLSPRLNTPKIYVYLDKRASKPSR